MPKPVPARRPRPAILRTLALGPNHGWGIQQRIHQVSREALTVSQGSRYPALHRLEAAGLLASEMTTSENNRKVVRTDGEPSAMAPTVRSVVGQLDPQATADLVAPMAQLVSNSVSRPRLYAVLMGIFALLAATLASVGTYGVMAYAVAQRTREIGIRMALGMPPSEIRTMFVRSGVVLAAAGILAGVAVALVVTRLMASLLFQVSPLDPITYVAVSALLIVTCAIASYLPARLATALDPADALRGN